ncbi:MAG: hypothetical protein GF364_11155 [Candidatus Lokiarchaeota archaeon]|nr:hypothetical protein [Candidatus Lokiarchaeota archaeon]
MKKIHFTVFSQAYYVDSNWGFGCPSGGIKRMGDICHYYNIPVTWVTSPKAVRCEQEMFQDFCSNHGDELAIMIRFEQKHHSNEREAAESWDVEKYREIIREQKDAVESYVDGIKVKIAGQGIRTQNMLEALQKEGFIGLFGHCYCQIGTDSITDFGMPWGSFRIRPNDFHLPARDNQEGLIAFEWTQRDLNRSFHTVFPELWSTDPNDVERGGVCTDENVQWWKNMFRQYERALELNEEGIWFQFHQEAHEMTWGEICKPFNEERVLFTADMMDEFLEWLVERDICHFMTASEAAKHYLDVWPKGTIPMYFPSAWTEVPEDLPFWNQIKTRKGYAARISKHSLLPNDNLYDYLEQVNGSDRVKAMKSPPWMDSFFYYDDECQLIFDIGQIAPIAIMNYLNYECAEDLVDEMKKEGGGGAAGFYLEQNIPKAEMKRNSNEEVLKIEVNYNLDKELPYGLFLWNEDFKSISKTILTSLENNDLKSIKRYKVSPDQGLFLRLNLKKGKNSISIKKGEN